MKYVNNIPIIHFRNGIPRHNLSNSFRCHSTERVWKEQDEHLCFYMSMEIMHCGIFLNILN